MSKLLIKFFIKAVTKSLTIEDIRFCGYLQEFIDCKLIDFISGFSVDKPEEYSDFIFDEAIKNIDELLKYKEN